MDNSKYDVNAIRQKLKQSQAGKFTDPDQFKPDKAKSATEAIKYRFYVLPPILQGDELKSGPVKRSMEQFFISHANHWINDKPHPCPRVWEGDDPCEICDFGFELLREEENQQEDKRRKVVKQWMPTTYNAVNIFFTSAKCNPEELRNKVKWYEGPKTCFDQWTAALMKEDFGDKEDPQAFGVFFDENAGFLYELQVLKQGRQNSYKTSKFLPNNGVALPMVRDAEGKANKKGLAALLKLRHNLWDKIEIPDPAKITKVYAVMISGDDAPAGGGFDADETETHPADTPLADTAETAAKKAPPKDEERDAVDSLTESLESNDEVPPSEDTLADEMPLDSPSDEAETVSEPEPVAAAAGDAVSGNEIDDLLSQLDDED